MTTFAYIRVSTEVQCHASQEYEIRQYCSRHHITIDRWVSESISGTVAVEKRLLGKTIESMSEGDALICTELSRLGRNMLMVMGILNLCSQKGVAIYTIKDNFVLSDNINSKIIAFAFALAAEIERILISQRTKEALAVKRLEGIRLGRPPGRSQKIRTTKRTSFPLSIWFFQSSPATMPPGAIFARNAERRFRKMPAAGATLTEA